MKKKFILTLTTGCLMATALFTGCGQTEEPAASKSDETAAVGHLTLSVNPEIMISYNKEGRVTDVKGTNSDGRDIVDDYDDYIGKYCGRVLTELVNEINDAGYFVEEAEGESKQIILELEKGSKLPDDDFLEELSGNVEQAVSKLDLTSNVVVRDDDSSSNYGASDYGNNDDSSSDYGNDSDDTNGASNYDDTDYGPNNDGATNYEDTDYGPDNDGATDFDDTDDAASNYDDNDDAASNYDDKDDAASNYDDNDDAASNYDDKDDAASNYDDNDDAASNYDDKDDAVSNYDDGESNYTPAPTPTNPPAPKPTTPPATAAPTPKPTNPPAVQKPVQTPAGDSGYDSGDSGYDAGSNYGDSGYDD